MAWYNQCQACHELAQSRLELLEDQPAGALIQVYRCLDCDGRRACRVGWRTRCHVCLDDRSYAPWIGAPRPAV